MPKNLLSSGARSFADHAYGSIKRDIVLGNLEAGSKLPLESLARRYNVGMAPLREALTRLVGETFVVAESQRGFWVAPLSLAELDDLSHVRTLIETEALMLSIQHGDAQWRIRLEDAYTRLCEVEKRVILCTEKLGDDEAEEWESLNQAFHRALLSECGSQLLLRLQDMTYQQSLKYRHASRRASVTRRRVDDEHAAIFEAAMAGNILKACRATEIHIALTADEVRKIIQENLSDEVAKSMSLA